MADFVTMLEPDAVNTKRQLTEYEIAVCSIAISLKRIADLKTAEDAAPPAQ